MRTSKLSMFRRVLRAEVIALCVVAFLADIITGVLGATFSLYAEDLGASVTLIGVLTSLSGLTALVGSVPLGIISDQIGRTQVLIFGMASFVVAMTLFATAPSPMFLIPGRLLLGLALVSSFWIAAAYLGDIVTGPERGIAFGLFTTAMGLGFAVGPLLGGIIAERYSLAVAYGLSGILGFVAIGVIIVFLRGRFPKQRPSTGPRISIKERLQVGRQRAIVTAGLANILSAIAFGGAISTIFPLYGSKLGITEASIGTMFAVRALASTGVRLPSGALVSLIGSRQVVLGALFIEMVAIIGIGFSDSYGQLLLWLVLEGVGFGAFLASAQAYIAEHSVEASRGAAIGFFSMSGGLGNTLAPLALGVVAEFLGLVAVFFVSGGLLATGLAVICFVWFRTPVPTPSPREEGPAAA